MKIKTSRILFSAIVCLTVMHTRGQWYDPEKVNKKAGEIYGTALMEAQDGKYTESLLHLEEALKYDKKFVDVYLTRAGVYADLRDYTRSVIEFETGLMMDSVYSKTYYLPYAISLAGAGKFERALDVVNEFLRTPSLNERSIKAGNYRKRVFEFAVEYAKAHPSGNYVFAPMNLGDSINTPAGEYFPSFTIDGKKMIFNRREKDEDFFETYLVDGHWSKARPVAGKLNTNFNEGAQNISQDGQWLVFTGCDYPEGLGSCDLYISHQSKNGTWSEAENLGPLINTDFKETAPSLSPDKRDLYFSSGQAGGYGGMDIWVSHRQPNGKWGRPVNLGPEINSDADESCPFIHPDNHTLYFNSTGHMGYGMADIFVSRKLANGEWEKPENLGYPVNTIDEEGSLVVTADGKTAYYASERGDGRGTLDIYSFRLRDDVAAKRTLWIKGKVFDKKTSLGLPSSVELTDISTRQVISLVQTDEEGNYLITLPEGKNYAFNVNRKGYLFYSDNFSLISNQIDTPIVINIPLQPIESGASIVLKNIFFDHNKFQLKPESVSELDKVVQLMRDNPKLIIELGGHTDNVGADADNMKLSVNRAKAVIAHLLNNQVDPKRLTYKGYGSKKPVASNETEEGKAMNRRTELNIISN
jgi:outer membrane protein OmpA-like peptidoglycan-associated protein/tetratricopeptide (TPR) repeat protein